MTKVLINGAGGFIGGNLVRRFIKAGYDVRASDIPQADLSWAEALGAEIVPASLTDPEAIDKSVEGCDVIIHTAAIFNLSTPRDTILKVNVEGTRHYCEAALKHKVERIVQFSSVGVYGVPAHLDIKEDGPKAPRNAYEESKWRSEQLGQRYYLEKSLPITTIRPTLVYGPGSRYGQSMYIGLFCGLKSWGLDSLPLPQGGKINHQVHVQDVCSGVQALVEAPIEKVIGRAFNVADADPLDTEEAMEIFCNATGIEMKSVPEAVNSLALVPVLRYGKSLIRGQIDKMNQRLEKTWKRFIDDFDLEPALNPSLEMGWLDYFWADHRYSTEALQSLGWKPEVPSLKQGMPETIEWYREQRWIPQKHELAEYAQRRKAQTASKSPGPLGKLRKLAGV